MNPTRRGTLEPARRAVRALALVGPLLCAPVLAAAADGTATPATAVQPTEHPEDRAKDLYLEGKAAYAEGRYEDAIAKFEAAFELSSKPLLLYNLSLAYERIGQYDKAVENLRGYLAAAPEQEQEIVRKRIQNLKKRIQADAEAAASGAASAAPPQKDDALKDVEDFTPEVLPPTPPPPPPTVEMSGRGLNVPAVVAFATGGVLLVGAGVLGGLALAARDEAQGHCTFTADGRNLCRTEAREPMARDRNLSLATDISLAAGVVSAGVGVLFLALDPGAAPPAVLTVSPAAGGAQVGLATSF